MRRKIVTYTLLGAAVVVIAVGGIFAKRNDFGLSRNMEIMLNLMHTLSTEYVDEVDADKLMQHGANGFSSMLDPYTTFIPEKDMPDFKAATMGKYGGVGAMIRQKENYVIIAEPYKGSPADEAGLKIGDKIVAINGQDMRNAKVADISKLLRGEPNTTVKVTIERLLTGEREEIKIRRRHITVPSIPYAGYVSEGVGYIRHSDFTERCYEDMRAAILRLQSEGKLKALVLDYRNNGGGLLSSAIDILSLFVPKGTMVVEMRGRSNGNTKKFYTQYDPLLPNIPLVVLINNNSASAAEIVSGTIQDLDRGVLIGQRSFGKGLVQTTVPLGYNAYAKVTTAKYYIPSGRCIQAVNYSDEGRATAVADSLIKEFKTAKGRKVYDGGGIMPDKPMKEKFVSKFAVVLYMLGIVEEYCDEYYKANHAQQIDLDTFSITEADYANFAKMVEGRDVPFKSDSRIALEMLQRNLKRERNTSLDAVVKQLEEGLKDDKQSLLQTFRKEITEQINENIVLRHAYAAGVVRHSLHNDEEVKAAVELLHNNEEYTRIVTKQDTARK